MCLYKKLKRYLFIDDGEEEEEAEDKIKSPHRKNGVAVTMTTTTAVKTVVVVVVVVTANGTDRGCIEISVKLMRYFVFVEFVRLCVNMCFR